MHQNVHFIRINNHMEKSINEKLIDNCQNDILEKNIEFALYGMEKSAPEETLYDRIMEKIELQEKGMAIKKLVFSSSIFLVCLVILGISYGLVQSEMAKSGTSRILNLFLLDWNVLLANWKDYTMYLLESLPVYPIIAALGSTMLLLVIFKLLEKTFISSFEVLLRNHKKTI